MGLLFHFNKLIQAASETAKLVAFEALGLCLLGNTAEQNNNNNNNNNNNDNNNDNNNNNNNNKNRPISKHPFSWIGSCEMPRAANQGNFGSNDMHTDTVILQYLYPYWTWVINYRSQSHTTSYYLMHLTFGTQEGCRFFWFWLLPNINKLQHSI